MSFLKIKYLMVLTLMLCCMGVFSIPALASDGGETLIVNAAWIDGELLRINVTDAEGDSSALALRLSDYVDDAQNKEYIAIQAVDLAGNKSGVIEIKNPYYDPAAKPEITTPTVTPNEPPQSSESAITNGSKPADDLRPFTPDGTGSVMDNAADGDGKEFFTIETEDGSVFYMIVDRQRDADNVYLLNSVTLDDLVALADKSGQTINTGNNGTTSAIDMPGQPNTTEGQNPSSTTSPEPTTESAENPTAKSDTSMYIIIGIAVVAVGGAGYYFKIVKGKKDIPDDDGEDEDDYGYDSSADEDDAEDGGDEE